MTMVGETEQYPYYFSSATIDPVSGRMFWAVMPYDTPGYLAEVNLATGATTKVYDFPGGEEVVGLAVRSNLFAEGAPGAVTNVHATFEGSSLSGAIAFKMPETLYNGSSATISSAYQFRPVYTWLRSAKSRQK